MRTHMKTLLVTLMAVMATLSTHAEQTGQRANELVLRIRTVLPKGWTVSYEKSYSWLEISRNKSVLLLSELPNLPPGEKPTLRKWLFAFRAMAFVSPADHDRLSAENKRIQNEADALYEELVKRRISQKFDSFSPSTEADKVDVARYEKLKASLHKIPDFYFRDISLKLGIGSPDRPWGFIVNEREREECAEVEKKVIELLSAYESAQP